MPKFDLSATFLFREYPLLSRFQMIRDCGVAEAELQSLEGISAQEIAAAAAAADIRIVLMNAPLGDFTSGGYGLSGVPGRQKEFKKAFQQCVDDALVLGAPLISIGPSLIPDDCPAEECLEVYYENIAVAIDQMGANNLTLLIEPVNRVDYPDILTGSTLEAVTVIKHFSTQKVALQFDIYHTAMNGEDIMQEFNRHISLIRHVQFSDAPGRHEPGTGTLDFSSIFKVIDQSNYQGFVGAEYHPLHQSTDTFQWLAENKPQL